jgi:hypothetical protein
MRQFHISNVVRIALFQFFTLAVTSAVTPDSRLISLVPPNPRMVAGMRAASAPGQPDSYLLITHNNAIDLRDFISLSGVDDSRVIDQVVQVAAANDRGILEEHSLLASGHFNQTRIFKSAMENGASVSEYKGIRVLVLLPFERDLNTFNHVRWLAVIDSNVIVFGTIPSVQQELERYLARSAVDPSLMEKLARLRRDDETWCVLEAFVHNYEIRRQLGSLDPVLADPVHDGAAFLFGIHFGRHVEFEYEITAPSRASTQAIPLALRQSPAGTQLKRSSLLPVPDLATEGTSIHGAVKISRSRYETWLGEVEAHGHGRNIISP